MEDSDDGYKKGLEGAGCILLLVVVVEAVILIMVALGTSLCGQP